MSIVLNEMKWAETAIAEKELGRHPFEALSRVAKYYTYQGCKKADVRKKLDAFLMSCDPSASLVAWSDTLDNAAKYAGKYPLVMIDAIPITKPEMGKIDSLPGKQLQRVAFTLLCIAKYMHIVAPETDYWVSTPNHEIMSLANVNTSLRRQGEMFNKLMEAGLIRFSKKIDNLSVQVLFAQDGDEAMRVVDFRNLGYQYMRYHGGSFFVCENCGLTTKIDNPDYISRRKYCAECAAKIHTQQIVNSIMRRRRANCETDERGKTYTIYMHEFPNGKRYIGKTSSALRDRWENGCGYYAQDLMKNAIKECGWDCVRHFILMDQVPADDARVVEVTAIQQYKSYDSKYGYNIQASKYSVGTFADRRLQEITFDPVEVDGYGNVLV